jgi:hypothetical protein
MGRPLNKKYFGNRNIGSSSTTADDGIGGGWLASVSNATVGAIQINDTYKTFPLLEVADPALPGGVTATLAVTWEIATIVVSSGGTGYTNNQTGAAVTTVTGLYSQADTVPVLTLDTNGSNAVTAVNITSRGAFTDIDGTGITTWAVVGAGGSNAQITVTFRIKSIAVTEQGSGYTATPALSWSQVNGGTMPSAQTVTMGTDSTTVGTTGDQENAIVAYAYVTGGSNKVADIVKQVSTDRYKVKTADGTMICQLVTDGVANAAGEMTITATDSASNTYYVKKLTAHRATLVQIAGGSNYVYDDNESAPWSFDAAADDVVQIANK